MDPPGNFEQSLNNENVEVSDTSIKESSLKVEMRSLLWKTEGLRVEIKCVKEQNSVLSNCCTKVKTMLEEMYQWNIEMNGILPNTWEKRKNIEMTLNETDNVIKMYRNKFNIDQEKLIQMNSEECKGRVERECEKFHQELGELKEYLAQLNLVYENAKLTEENGIEIDDALEAEYNKLKQELEELEQETEKNVNLMESAQKKIEYQGKMLETKELGCVAATDQTEYYEKLTEQLEAKIDSNRAFFELNSAVYTKMCDDKKKRAEELGKEGEKIDQIMGDSESTMQLLNLESKNFESDLEVLGQQLAEFRSRTLEYNQGLQEMQNNLSQIQDSSNNLETVLSNTETELSDFNINNNSDLIVCQENYDQINCNLQQQLDEIIKETDRNTLENKEMQEKCDEFENKKKMKYDELEMYNSENLALNNKIGTVQSSIDKNLLKPIIRKPYTRKMSNVSRDDDSDSSVAGEKMSFFELLARKKSRRGHQ